MLFLSDEKLFTFLSRVETLRLYSLYLYFLVCTEVINKMIMFAIIDIIEFSRDFLFRESNITRT